MEWPVLDASWTLSFGHVQVRVVRRIEQMDINPNTGKGGTDAEEVAFAGIVRIGRVQRIKAIELFRRCKSDCAKAVKLARDNHGLSDLQTASYGACQRL